ncbi:unnamed protein product, partial [Ectocarpus sp. 12 AP-2014]
LTKASQELTSDSNMGQRRQPLNRDQQNRVDVATTAPLDRCTFCAGPHSTVDCCLDLSVRRDIIQQRKGCYACFEPYVTEHECQSIETCPDCRQRHSALIGCRPVR